MDFRGKTIWITGAASGMGRALALELAKYGTKLILTDRDAEGLRLVTLEARQLAARQVHTPADRELHKPSTQSAQQPGDSGGTTIYPMVLDMADSRAIEQCLARLPELGLRVQALYQFAGISQRSLLMETPLENDRKIMEINYFGPVILAKALLPQMIAGGGGQLAVASSLVGKFGFPYRSAYSASKHALHGFFESLAAENHQQGLRVSIIVGGRIRTNISKFALDKDGREHGRMDPGQAGGISPEKAARQILRGLRKQKAEIPVGGSELLILGIRRFFPALHRRLVRKIKPM